MPKEYTDIKNSYLKKGKSKEEAERIAAATYNSKVRKHKKDSRPVGNKAQQKSGSALPEDLNDPGFIDFLAEMLDKENIKDKLMNDKINSIFDKGNRD